MTSVYSLPNNVQHPRGSALIPLCEWPMGSKGMNVKLGSLRPFIDKAKYNGCHGDGRRTNRLLLRLTNISQN